jgi:hypothetical protein
VPSHGSASIDVRADHAAPKFSSGGMRV